MGSSEPMIRWNRSGLRRKLGGAAGRKHDLENPVPVRGRNQIVFFAE
ncbi:MAG: hypothetical protein ABGZ17_01455 [Planctomycetaceae bacterium]